MTPPPGPKSFFLIRTAMAVGVTAFVLIGYFVASQRTTPFAAVAQLRTLTTVMYVSVGIAAAVIMALRLRIASAEPPMQRSLSVVAWAVGEFAALFGGVLLMLTGDWRLALPGALVFALSLAAVRIPEA
jgi:hypothetical protein